MCAGEDEKVQKLVEQSPSSTLSATQTPVQCRYRLGSELGTGSYSIVSEVRHITTGNMYAAKILNKKLMRGREHLVKNEIIVLKRVSRDHPNILTLVDYFETIDSLYLVTELAKGGELFDRVYSRGAYLESDAAQLMKQITSGVCHLHSHGIVHRDLKLENLLFQTRSPTSRLLICDFGLSRIIDEENFRMLTTTVGTPSYMAPEVFSKKGHGKPVDVWALGVIAYLLLSGFTPFDRESAAEEREAIERGDVQFVPEKYWAHITADAQEFIKSCLQVDPRARPTALECLNSKFLTRKYHRTSDITGSNHRQELDRIDTLDGQTMNGAFSEPPEPDKKKVFVAKWG